MEHTDLELIAQRGHGTVPVETYRGREIYRTADRTLVIPPAGHEYCVAHLRESDEGATLHTEATIEACRQFIEEDEPDVEGAIAALGESAIRVKAERDALLKALNGSIGYLLNAKIDLETGASKATAIKTIEGGIRMAREAITKVTN